MATLSVGSKFRQNFATSTPLQFEVLEIDRSKDWCRVKCTKASEGGSSWEENWDDLHYAEAALDIGEYAWVH